MQTYTYVSKGKFELREKPKPVIMQERDAIVKVTLASICSSDLHIKHGSVPRAVSGITVGHEMVGIVEEVGSAITHVKPGDRVTVNVETFCGECFFCKNGYVNNCTNENGGWALGCRSDGGQAEYVRVPFADQGLNRIPKEVTDRQALLVGDVLATGYWAARISEVTKEDINLLGRVTDQVFSESEEWDIDTVSETIASEYERATNLSINKEKQNLPIEEKRTIDVKEIREWLNFIITIISVVLGVTNSSATTINNYNYTQQVNNYYIVGMGYDAKELNTTKYRIVNRESIVRLKHDCHSIVIEKLEEGKVVRIIDKYKKWRQIIWENEDGEECMGWIQNYKLTEFKVPRNK